MKYFLNEQKPIYLIKACKKILFYFYFYGSLNSDIVIHVLNNILFRIF